VIKVIIEDALHLKCVTALFCEILCPKTEAIIWMRCQYCY